MSDCGSGRETGYRCEVVTAGLELDLLGHAHLWLRMPKPVNIDDAKARLSELVDRAAAGEEVIIAKAGQPFARLVPLRVRERTPGRGAGRIDVARDFDAPLPKYLLRDFGGGE